MPDSRAFTSDRHSRRTLLALLAGAAATSAAFPVGALGRQAADSTPVAGTPSIARSLPADASPLLQAVAEAVVQTMGETLVPGVAVGIMVGDWEEHAAFGVASKSSTVPVTTDTLFQSGSITKTVTATGIWHLIDEGVLDLEAPVRTYLPELATMDPEVAEQVTIANLLDHSAGWYGDEGFDTGSNDDALARYVAERVPQLPQVFPLGEYFSYNNAGFSLLGRLIEVSTGVTYNAAIENLVLGPLGLADSLLDPVDVRQRPYADGHATMMVNDRVSTAVMTPLWIPRSVDPAGGIWTTTRDLVRYARFHSNAAALGGAGSVVQPESLALMQEPVIDVPGATALQMGRDWFVQDIDGVRTLFHSGDTPGQHADLFMIPEHGFVLAILTNGQGGGSAVGMAALDAALAQIPALSSLIGKLGLVPEMTVTADTPKIDLSPEQMDEYVGTYADSGTSVTFTRSDAGLDILIEMIEQPGAWLSDLTAAPVPKLPVSFVAEDTGSIGATRLPFVRNADGSIGWLSMGLRLIPRVEA